jgi:hypothetical protein
LIIGDLQMQPNFRNDITMLAVGTTVNTNSPSQESANNDPKNTLTLLTDVALQTEASETSASSKAPATVRIKERLLRKTT